MGYFIICFVFLYGLLFGSFFNVCIYRIPAGLSIIRPGSRCGTCEHPLAWKDLMPILSYVSLGAKCRYCKALISVRYPLVELLTGILFVLVYLKFGLTFLFLKYLVLVSILIVLSFIDWDHKIIPDRLNLGIGILAVATLAYQPEITWIQGAIGFAVGGGFLFLIALLTGAMGGGDIKLMAAAGLMLGTSQIIIALYFGFIVGGVVSLFLLLMKIKGRKDAIAFGPYLSIGIIIAVFYGNEMMARYLQLIN